jgi:hypothetical protein
MQMIRGSRSQDRFHLFRVETFEGVVKGAVGGKH